MPKTQTMNGSAQQAGIVHTRGMTVRRPAGVQNADLSFFRLAAQTQYEQELEPAKLLHRVLRGPRITSLNRLIGLAEDPNSDVLRRVNWSVHAGMLFGWPWPVPA